MRLSTRSKTLARVVGVVAATMVVVSGVTFAALQSQQDTLTGNTIETATANLQLSKDGINYGDTQTGFDFNNLIPGGPAVPTAGYGFYLKNSGDTPLAVKFAINSIPDNPNNVDLSKVNLLVTTVGSGGAAQSFTLQSLIDASPSGGLPLNGAALPFGQLQQYKLQVSMTTDAIIGSSASLGNLDLVFSGVVQYN